MSDTAIRVENLGKLYRIGAARQRHDTLRDALSARFRNPSPMADHRPQTTDRGASSIVHGPSSTFWALRDVSFEVQRGEVVGVIGRNGAGKSTLLKILSRITEPTTGRVELHGRVGSLLEVGTGFHPELTGRENIYLNGAILGMKKAEIARRFDEIVAFAEIERFLDTPVKRYSSGMYVRLAFAVAAHLEPEILLVDEVLAVGDAAFQKKCLGKMGEVAGQGRTVLFVSHNMAAVEALCGRVCLLDTGRLVASGMPGSIIEDYIGHAVPLHDQDLTDRTDRDGSGQIRFTGIRFLDDAYQPIEQLPMGQTLIIQLTYDVREPIREPLFGILFADRLNRTVLRAYSRESYPGVMPPARASGSLHCRFERFPLMHGVYSVNLWLGHHRNNVIDYIENAARLTVLQKDVYGTGIPPDSNNGGVCFSDHTWQLFLQ